MLRAKASKFKPHRILAIMCVLGFSCISLKNSHNYSNRQLMAFREGMLNAISVKQWRDTVSSACKSAVTDEDMEEVLKMSRDFTYTLHENESAENRDLLPEFWIQRCPFVFLDVGTGAGDAVARFIDSGLEGCRRSDSDTRGFDSMHFDVDTGKFLEVTSRTSGESNKLFTPWVKERIETFYSGLGPEDYCVYGVEANPLLKDDLVKLERHVVRSQFSNFISSI